MKRCLLISILIGVFLFSACGAVTDVPSETSGLSVVSTTFPGYDLARAVIGDKGTVTMLLSPGEETHSFDPTPADIIAVQESDLFLYVGGESDDWVRDLLASMDTDTMNVISLMDCVSLYEEEAKDGMMESRGHDHEESHDEEDHEEEYDEHVWTSPINARIILEDIESRVCAMDAENADYYHANADRYAAELEKLDKAFRETVEQSENKTLLFGDRFPFLYFVREYGLDYYAAFPGCSSETEPNAATIAFLIDKGREEKIPVVLKEKMSNDNIASAIAEETGSKVCSLYACHNIPADDFENGETYVSLMNKNLVVLKEALNGWH